MNLIDYFKALYTGFSTILFPPICKGCNHRIVSNEEIFCSECWSKLLPIPEDVLSEKEIPEYVDNIYAVFQFDDIFQNIVHALKYQSNPSIGIELGIRVGEFLKTSIFSMDKTVLVPIPLHPAKHRERGYNQAEAIARGISTKIDFPLNTKLIKREKNTTTQTKLSAEERKENMRDAFTLVSDGEVSDIMHAILVDDVFTTGSTINSAAKTLHEAGIQVISAITAGSPIQ